MQTISVRFFQQCLALALVVASPSVFAATIFDNRGETTSGSQVADAGSVNGWWGQAFSTTATDAEITEVTLEMLNTNAASTFSVAIYSSVAGATLNEPGSIIQTIYSGTPGTFFPPFTIDELSVSLTPSTDYFVVVSPTVGSVQWDYTNAVTGLNSNSLDQAVSWTSSNSAPFQMSVVAVPEPAPVSLLAAAGFASVVAMFCRRRAAPVTAT